VNFSCDLIKIAAYVLTTPYKCVIMIKNSLWDNWQMKIKIKKATVSEALSKTRTKRVTPKKPDIFFRTLLKIVSQPDLKATNFKLTKIGMEKLGKKQPCLFLMNHESFIDLKIAVSSLYPRPFNIICTEDGLIGLKWLLRNLGCVPTRKFVPDMQLIRDMQHCLTELNSSVLMYPEAGYSIDGSATALPESLGRCVKLLGAPVVTIISDGAFNRQPLFNQLKKREVNVTATMEYLLSPEDVKRMSADEINDKLKEKFSFDAFRDQFNGGVIIDEPDRAAFLNRVLYKCPHCGAEGKTVGEGVTLTCSACGKVYELLPSGKLESRDGDTKFSFVTDWYAWERECVKDEILNGSYSVSDEVEIYMVVNTKALYHVGEGLLSHDQNGFNLFDKEGKTLFTQGPLFSYSVNVDFNWYEIGDVICIGNADVTYCCIPKNLKDVVAKVRLGVEESYKIAKAANKHK